MGTCVSDIQTKQYNARNNPLKLLISLRPQGIRDLEVPRLEIGHEWSGLRAQGVRIVLAMSGKMGGSWSWK